MTEPRVRGSSWRRRRVAGRGASVVVPFVAAALPRYAYLLIMAPPFTGVHWGLSDSVLRDGSLSTGAWATTDFEPLYAWFLAGARLLTNDSAWLVQVVQLLVSSLGAVFMYRLTTALTNRPRVATIAACLYGLYPLALRQALAQNEAALLTPLLILFAWLVVRTRRAVDGLAAGGCLGLVILTRMTTLPLVGLAAVLLVSRRRYRASVALVLTTVTLTAPLLIGNWSMTGRGWPTRSGLNLYIGNSPYTPSLLPRYDLDLLAAHAYDLVARERPDLREAAGPVYEREVDAILTRHALQQMAQDPLTTVRRKLLNVAYFFWPTLIPFEIASAGTRVVIGPGGGVRVERGQPRPLIEHLLYVVSYWPVAAAAFAGVFLRRRELHRDAILWCIALTFTLVHAWYFPATRYRGPIEFVLLFYAAIAIDRGVSWMAVSQPPFAWSSRHAAEVL